MNDNICTYRKGLMTQFPCARGRAFVCKNIGDYVQAVATRQYIDKIDEYIEQEEANQYFPNDKKKIRLIMNGWFQWRSENWPPSEYIYPLLISMHISPIKANDLLTPEGIEFLKKYSPVGCRDYYTKKLLETAGIPSYFSACMTLTLGKKYKVSDDKRKGIYIVDPYFEIPELFNNINGKKKLKIRKAISSALYFLFHINTISKLAKNDFFKIYSPTGFLDKDESKYRRYYKAIMFYKVYSKKFDKNLLLNAEYITHWMNVNMDGGISNDDLLNIAESFVKKYAAARLVITSRIHAGLPCLGLETPVIFIANNEVISDKGTFNTPGRLGGIVDLFRVLELKNDKFLSIDEIFKKINKFGLDTTFNNKTEWQKYAGELDKKATEFMKN